MPQSGTTFYWENLTMRHGESNDPQSLVGVADEEIRKKCERKLLTCYVND